MGILRFLSKCFQHPISTLPQGFLAADLGGFVEKETLSDLTISVVGIFLWGQAWVDNVQNAKWDKSSSDTNRWNWVKGKVVENSEG